MVTIEGVNSGFFKNCYFFNNTSTSSSSSALFDSFECFNFQVYNNNFISNYINCPLIRVKGDGVLRINTLNIDSCFFSKNNIQLFFNALYAESRIIVFNCYCTPDQLSIPSKDGAGTVVISASGMIDVEFFEDSKTDCESYLT